MARSMGFESIRSIMRMGDRKMEPPVIRDITGENINNVAAVLTMQQHLKSGNWRLVLEQFANKQIRSDWITVAAEELQMEIPGLVKAQIRDIAAGRPWPDKVGGKKAEEEKSVEAPAAPAVEDHWKEEKLLLGQIAAALTAQNELLTQLIDTVLPRYVGDLKDNVNVNADLLAQRAKGCEDKIEAIKLALRKRGM